MYHESHDIHHVTLIVHHEAHNIHHDEHNIQHTTLIVYHETCNIHHETIECYRVYDIIKLQKEIGGLTLSKIEELLQRPFYLYEIASLLESEKVDGNSLLNLLDKDEKNELNLQAFWNQKENLSDSVIEGFNDGFVNKRMIYPSELAAWILNDASVFNKATLLKEIEQGGSDDTKKIRRIFGKNKSTKLIKNDFNEKVLGRPIANSYSRIIEQNELVDLDFIAHSLDMFIEVDESAFCQKIREIREELGRPIVFSLMNQKGGAGKTTSAVTIADRLAELGLNVVLGDSDEQGNATSTRIYLPVRSLEDGRNYKSMAEIFSQEAEISETIIPTNNPNLSIIPSSLDIEDQVLFMNRDSDSPYRLKEAIERFDSNTDVMILDCPPHRGLAVVNNLVASDFVVIPAETQDFSADGYEQLIRTVRKVVEGGLNPSLSILGYFMTKVGRTNTDKEMIRGAYDDLFEGEGIYELGRISYILDAKKLKEKQTPIFEYAKGTKLAGEYSLLVNQILRRTVERMEGDD